MTVAPSNIAQFPARHQPKFADISHSEACNRARVTLSENGFTLFRREVGLFRDERGNKRYLGTAGEPDLQGWTDTGIFAAVEIKTGKAVRSKPQKNFAAAITRAGGFYLVARYAADADGDELIRHAIKLWRQGRGS